MPITVKAPRITKIHVRTMQSTLCELSIVMNNKKLRMKSIEFHPELLYDIKLLC
jgi:glutamine amidotransferase PdxT